jgi:Rrf2 family protein
MGSGSSAARTNPFGNKVSRSGIHIVLSQKTRYALKALLELAMVPPGTRLSSVAISARRNIPVKFLEAILVELKRDGLVRGQRGRNGGYELAQPPDNISFGDVVRLMEGPLALIPCVSVTQYHRCVDCVDDRSCELRKLFREVRDRTAEILDGRTLADALREEVRPGTGVGVSQAARPDRGPPAKRSTGREKQRPRLTQSKPAGGR